MGTRKSIVEGFAKTLAATQNRHPIRFLVFAGLVSVLAGIVAPGLLFDSSYEALLPEDSPEVANADRVRDQTGGTRQVVIAVKGPKEATRIEFSRRLVERLERIPDVRYVDLEFPVSFFEERALWMMSPEALDKLIPALEEAVRVAKWQANPMNLHLDPDQEKKELEAVWRKVDDIVNAEKGNNPFSRILTSKDGKYTFILVTPSIKFMEVAVGRALFNKLQQAIESLHPAKNGLDVTIAGNLAIMQEQNQVMVSDSRAASILAFGIGIVLIAAALRRLLAPFLIGIALLFGVAWTFAFARLAIGHLNIITGFLVAVLIGLGIDFGVHLFMRFQQEVRLFNQTVEEAVSATVVGTFPPALTSALTTAGTFLTFAVADFRGFSEFGIIASVGVMLTLCSSFIVLPPIFLLVGARGSKNALVKPSSHTKSPGLRVTVPIFGVFMASALYGAFHVDDIPFKNNFRELRGSSPATHFMDYVDKSLGMGVNPAVFVAGRLDDAEKLKRLAQTQQMEGLDGRSSRISRVFSITDMLPKETAANRPRIDRLREILLDPKLDAAEAKGGKRAEQLALARRMANADPWTIEDLPVTFKRRMTTVKADGYIVLLWPNAQTVDSDRIALEWEDELEHLARRADALKLDYQKADETLILAWIYRTIVKDALPVLILVCLVVFTFLFLDFRNVKNTLLVAFPLATGMLAFVGILHAMGLTLNMFNMIVLPAVIGIGIDNAVHIFHRYQTEGPGSIMLVIRTTGMGTLLASLTTAVGFGSTIIAHNVGLQTLGLLAVIGIGVTCASSLIFFPCVLILIERIHPKKRDDA